MSVSKFGTSENYTSPNYDSQIIGGLSAKATKIQNGVVNNLVTVKNEDGEIEDSRISKSSLLTIPFLNDLNIGGKRITNIGNPTSSTDAVNKDYVDTQVVNLINEIIPVRLQIRIARIITRNSGPQYFTDQIVNDIFRNNVTQNIYIFATTTYQTSNLNLIIVPKITHYTITDNILTYGLHISNGDNCPWPQEARFDVVVQVLAYSQRQTHRFRSALVYEEVHTPRKIGEASRNDQTELTSAQNSDPQVVSFQQLAKTNVAKSYLNK
jgi:hypothetical protein